MYLLYTRAIVLCRIEGDSKSFPLIFAYLEDPGLQGDFWVAIENIADKLFEQFLSQLEKAVCLFCITCVLMYSSMYVFTVHLVKIECFFSKLGIEGTCTCRWCV